MIAPLRCLTCHADILRPDATDRATHLCRDCRLEARQERIADDYRFFGYARL